MKLQNRQFAATLVLLLGPVLPAMCSAEIYGWIDAAGVVTYSNLPPPGGVDVTQVIHEEPVSPKAAAEAAQRAETEALKDRIRLLELEMSRPQPVPVEYPVAPEPSAPVEAGCGPYGYDDCNVYWYWPGWWPRHRYYYRGRERGAFGPGRPIAPIRSAAHAAARGGGGSGGGHGR